MGGVLFFFFHYPPPLQDLLATVDGCLGDDGVGKLFGGIKNMSFCCFMVTIFFLQFYR